MTQIVMFVEIEAWENEGGAGLPLDAMKGTAAQVEWAARIVRTVGVEFDRIAKALRSIALEQDAEKRADTEAIIAVLAEKRAEVMSIDSAGFLIRNWQDIGDRVRNLLLKDPRYGAIACERAARRRRRAVPELFVRGRPA